MRWAPWIALGVLMAFWPGRAYGRRRDVGGAWLDALQPGRGRSARRVSEIPARGWRDILWRTWREMKEDEIPRVAGGITFFGLLSLFPGIGAFVALYGLFADVDLARQQILAFSGVVPPAAARMIGEQMLRIAGESRTGLGFAFAASLAVSLWSANAGVKALFHGLNIAYDETEKRNFLQRTALSLAFTVGAIVFLVTAMSAVVVAPLALSLLNIDAGALGLLRWPLLLVVAVAGLSIVYRYGPSRERPRWRWVTWGGVVAALTWIAGSVAFSAYLSNFAHYDRTYGAFGALFGAMIWLWMSAVIVLVGAELNAEIEHQTAVDSTTGKAEPLGRRGATVADTVGRAF